MLSVTELSALMSAQLKRGVFTNSAMTAGQYLEDDPDAEVAESGNSLLILRHRPGFLLLNYYIQENCETLDIPPFAEGLPVVCETVYRPKDQAAALRTLELLKNTGFTEAAQRIRLTREEWREEDCPGYPVKIAVELAETVIPSAMEEGADAFVLSAESFLGENFDPLTGCIPPMNILAKDRFAVVRTNGRIDGMLHFSVGRNFWEIRHLAVARELRGKGVAAKLLAAAQINADCSVAAQTNGVSSHLRCRVWTGADNAAAIKFYTKHGFIADAYKSTILIKNTK